MKAIFVDTWAFLAMANRRDLAHDDVLDAYVWLDAHGSVRVTSDLVLQETLTALRAAAGPEAALHFLDDFEAIVAAGEMQLVRVGPEGLSESLALFRKLAPRVPRLSLTDCSSLVVMKRLELTLAFSSDPHFAAAGRSIAPLFWWENNRLVRAPIPV
ncbi:MAG: type II toxin-antitoxin system VapC family toxin [Archangium sp.]|nr:type II toxin-antitoxin system VapC family toxin [Archangium sp.]